MLLSINMFNPFPYAVGGDSAFFFGSIHTKKAATETWDHAIPPYPLTDGATDVLALKGKPII